MYYIAAMFAVFTYRDTTESTNPSTILNEFEIIILSYLLTRI